MEYEIIREDWHICKICESNIRELAKKYGGCGIYYTKVFQDHLKVDHNLELEDYFINKCQYPQPVCPCGICNQKLAINRGHKTSNFTWEKIKCGRNEGQKKWSKEAKITRQGVNNPMFGKKPWNKGLDINDPTIAKLAEKNRGKKTSEATKQKQSESAKKRLIHGHTGHKHSPENVKKMRERTLKRYTDGKFKQTKTKPHIAMSIILNKMDIEYNEEKTVWYWSFDFYLPKYDLYIEVDGDYFHTNPKFYPDGPKTKTQWKNFYIQKKKDKYCVDNNISLLRFWECDILNLPDNIKERIECKLKQLSE